jgi:hypothetical protein
MVEDGIKADDLNLQNAAKVGLGVSVEAVPEDLMEMQDRAAAAGEAPSSPSMPF